MALGLMPTLAACTSTAPKPHAEPDANIANAPSDAGASTLAPATSPSSRPTSSSVTTTPTTPAGTESTRTIPASTSSQTTTNSPSTTFEQLTSDQSASDAAPSDALRFEPPGGTFVERQTVRLNIGQGQEIRYTLDGTLPDSTSMVYEAPIELDDTAVIRTWVAPSDDTTTGVYAAQPYVKLRADVADFSSNLPLVVINRHRDEPLDRESNELRAASLLVFEPGDEGRTKLLGQASLAMRSGVRVRGAYSRAFPQVSYAVETWQAQANEDQAVPFLGMPAESDWVLSAPSQIDRALMRNRFAMDVSRELGQYASRAAFVEVFLVDNRESASLGKSDYMGVYTALEKIKRDTARVDVEKLDEAAVDAATIGGGYIFRIDRDVHFSAGGHDFGWVYPDPEIMAQAVRSPQVEYLRNYLTEFFTSLTSEAFIHPVSARHYSDYVELDTFIDHNLVTGLTKNVDGLRLSSYFFKPRQGRVVAGPVWDFDRSLGTPHDERAVQADEWATGDGTNPLVWGYWDSLFSDEEFARAYWARWDELRSSTFEHAHLVALLDGYEEELNEARERHFERWPELPPDDSPAHEVEIIRNWLALRLEWLDSVRREAEP